MTMERLLGAGDIVFKVGIAQIDNRNPVEMQFAKKLDTPHACHGGCHA